MTALKNVAHAVFFCLKCPTNNRTALLQLRNLIRILGKETCGNYALTSLACSRFELLLGGVIDNELLSLVVYLRIRFRRSGYYASHHSELHLRSGLAEILCDESLLAHASSYGELFAFLASECLSSHVLGEGVDRIPTEVLILLAFGGSYNGELNGVGEGITSLHEASHSVGVGCLVKRELCDIAGLAVERKLLIHREYVLLAQVAAVKGDVRVGVYNGKEVVGGEELLSYSLHLFLCLLEVSLRGHNGEADVDNVAVGLLLVHLFMLLIERFDIALAYADGRVRDSIVGLHHVFEISADLVVFECIFGVERVSGHALGEQVVVFLLQTGDAYGLLPIHPIVFSLLEVSLLLCALGFLAEGADEEGEVGRAELSVLVEERAAAADELVYVLAEAEVGKLIRRYIHTDFFSLIGESNVREHHLPYLIADRGIGILVEIRTARLDFIHLCKLLFGCFIVCVMNFLTLDNAYVLAVTVEECGRGRKEVTNDKCEHSNAHNYDEQDAMFTN